MREVKSSLWATPGGKGGAEIRPKRSSQAGLKSLDEDGDGCISLEELRAAASKSEEVMHFLGAVL